MNLAFMAVILAAACSDPDTQNPQQATRVIVHMDGVPANVDTVQANVSLDGVDSPKNPIVFAKQLSEFYLDFPAPKNQGNAVINVEAYSKQCFMASGRGQTQLAGENTIEIHVTLSPTSPVTCALIVSVFGQGHVTSDPKGIDCVQEGQHCKYQYPLGTTVSLSASPDVPSAPYSWDDACSGSGMCSVKIDASASVSADFAPKVCTQANWCWENPRPQGNMLSGVWIAPNDQTLFAVGKRGTILIRKGINWVSSASGTSQNLRKVWGTSSTDVYAVGDHGTVLHWGGTGWSAASTGTTQDLSDVHGSSANDVWVTGAQGTVLRGSGLAFTAISPAIGNSLPVGSVWAFASNDAWASYWGGVAHWDGSKWTPYALTQSYSDVRLFGNAPNDMLAVDFGGATHKWNGSSWTMLQKIGTNSYASIWGMGTNTVWAAGKLNGTDGAIWRWDGTSWQSQTLPAPLSAGLWGIYGANSSSIVSVGESGMILNYDGTAWTNVGGKSLYQQYVYGIWANTPNDLWAAGQFGKVWRGNGVGWTAQDTGVSKSLVAVWGSAADDVWAVGFTGAIVRWNGQQWSVIPPITSYSLNDVRGSGPNDVWAVGDNQTVLHWNGVSSWVPMSPLPSLKGSQLSLYVASGSVFLCGQDGIFRWDGSQWTQESPNACSRIHGVALDAVYALGAAPNSVMVRSSSGQWTSSNDPAVRSMNGVYVAAPNDVWLVGGTSGSLMAHWDGLAWATIDSGMDSPASGIFGIGSKNLWMVGYGGMILRQRR